MIPSIAELKEVFDYNRDTGVLFWKIKSGSSSPGKPAGSFNKSVGYLCVTYLGKTYAVHRLAWAFEFGEFPPEQIDHINRDRLDNRISNLRSATSSENMKNCGMAKNNTSGVKGGRFHYGKWEAYQSLDDKINYLGRYESLEDAVAVVDEFRRGNGFTTDTLGRPYV